MNTNSSLTDVIGRYPYRMAFAGGWIDQSDACFAGRCRGGTTDRGEQTGDESEDQQDPSSSTHVSSVLLLRAQSERDYPFRYRHGEIPTGVEPRSRVEYSHIGTIYIAVFIKIAFTRQRRWPATIAISYNLRRSF